MDQKTILSKLDAMKAKRDEALSKFKTVGAQINELLKQQNVLASEYNVAEGGYKSMIEFAKELEVEMPDAHLSAEELTAKAEKK